MTKRPPTSDSDRALTGRGRARTPPAGVPVDPLAATTEDLDASYDDLTPPPVMVAELRSHLQSRGDLNVEHLEMAEAIAVRVMQSVLHMHQLQSNRLMQVAQAAPGSERTHQRLADLETWRKQLDEWRLRLTGVDEKNGRLGRMQDAIEDLREDVGTREQAKATRETAAGIRSAKNRAMAAIAAAAVAIGGGAYTFVQARESSARAAGRLEERLRHLEETDKRHDQALRWRGRGVPVPGIDFDNEPTRNP